MNTFAFYKPYGVLCQFSRDGDRPTLADYISVPDVYPCGRLDTDSEGLLILSDDGQLQARIAHPKFKLEKEYWVQVDGVITDEAIQTLRSGVTLKDGVTQPATCDRIEAPVVPDRVPPIRVRKTIPTSWIRLVIREGRNRQVRRMTAQVGFPTLRLIRARIGPITFDQLAPGESRALSSAEIRYIWG